jgi:hypothetical protein
MPSKTRSQAECRELAQFERLFSSRDDFPLPAIHNEAKLIMARGDEKKRGDFYEDVLRVKYSGPDVPSLTVVDLPGIIAQQLQGGSGAQKVHELITKYMRNDRSIILAVINADNNPEKQPLFTYLKEHDPVGSRTLGIITKPDRVERGGSEENQMMGLARNAEVPLAYGWHTVKNRNFSTDDASNEERDEQEREFFNIGTWSTMPRADVGIASLRAKLSHILLERIGMELPSIVTAIQGAVTATESSLKALGHARTTSKEQRAYLTGHAEKFQVLTHDALRGIYSNRLFTLSYADEQTPTRLRTAVQNLNIAFANVMYQKGHTWEVAARGQLEDESAAFQRSSNAYLKQYQRQFEDPTWINRTEFLEQHIGEYVQQSRPSGLPSLVNPWVIGEVFREQSRRWHDIAKHHLRQVFQAVKDYIEIVIGSLVDPRTRSLLMLKQVQPELERRWGNVEAKLAELLAPYTEQDPITYDPGFLRDLEEMRSARYTVKTGSKADNIQPSFSAGQHASTRGSSNSTQRLLTESLDDFTNSEILDLMQTYYKVSTVLHVLFCYNIWSDQQAERNLHLHQQHRSLGNRKLLDQRPSSHLFPNADCKHGRRAVTCNCCGV